MGGRVAMLADGIGRECISEGLANVKLFMTGDGGEWFFRKKRAREFADTTGMFWGYLVVEVMLPLLRI